jgi:hypothetical protein
VNLIPSVLVSVLFCPSVVSLGQDLPKSPALDQAARTGGNQLSVPNLSNIRYVTSDWNWRQSPSDDLATPGHHTIHLSPCPAGIDTNAHSNRYLFAVHIASKGGMRPTCALEKGSTDTDGVILATTGKDQPENSGTILLNFSSSTFGAAGLVCIYQASDQVGGHWDSLVAFKNEVSSAASDLFEWTNGLGHQTLAAETTYRINYVCFTR